MSKFKVGDRVRVKHGLTCHGCCKRYAGREFTISNVDDTIHPYETEDPGVAEYGWNDNELELVISNGDKPMGRRTFKLIKENYDFKAGAIFQEACDDGTQEYECLNYHETAKYLDSRKSHGWSKNDLARDSVEKEPKWFVEVFKVTPEYMTKAELDQFEAFKKGLKPAKRKYTKRAKKPSK